MTEDFSAIVQQEGVNPFAEQDTQEKETPATPPVDEQPKTESPSQEGGEDASNTSDVNQIPFNKHPRWVEREQEFNEKFNALRVGFDEKLEKLTQSPAQAPTWLKDIYGEDKEKAAEYLKDRSAIVKEAKEQALKELRAEQQKVQDDQKKWESWVDTEVSRLKDDGKKFNRNELMKIALDYKPTDDEGNISFDKAYDILEKVKPKEDKTSRKEIAAQTTSKPSSEAPAQKWKTPADLRGRGW